MVAENTNAVNDEQRVVDDGLKQITLITLHAARHQDTPPVQRISNMQDACATALELA